MSKPYEVYRDMERRMLWNLIMEVTPKHRDDKPLHVGMVYWSYIGEQFLRIDKQLLAWPL